MPASRIPKAAGKGAVAAAGRPGLERKPLFGKAAQQPKQGAVAVKKAAALRIQTIARGRNARNEARRMEASLVKLQAVARGHQHRVASEAAALSRKQESAALVVQRVLRGSHARAQTSALADAQRAKAAEAKDAADAIDQGRNQRLPRGERSAATEPGLLPLCF